MKLQEFSTTQIWNNSEGGDGEKCPGGSNMTLPTILGVCVVGGGGEVVPGHSYTLGGPPKLSLR